MRIGDVLGLIFMITVITAVIIGLVIMAKWLYNTFIYREDNIKKENIMNDIKSPTNSIAKRFLIIGAIALLMLIPLAQVSSIVDERGDLHHKVLSNIASQWGNPQVVTGPALILPIIEKYNVLNKVTDSKGNEKMVTEVVYKHKNVVILPKLLNKDIGLTEHYRYRGIYKSLVYTSKIKVAGEFTVPNISKLSDNLDEVRYDKAYMLMGLSDTKAIEHVSKLTFGASAYSFEPGTKLTLTGINGGFHAPLELKQNQQKYAFNFNLKTNGSSSIHFSAFGEETTINLNSSWKHPSFQGAILPMERNITNKGFSAKWKIPSLARNFPQTWIKEQHNYNLASLLTGVNLFEPVALYSLVDRSVKYGVLFILLTFLTFLVFEVTQKSKLHYVQYVLIGLSLGLFFLTLLSLSEHIEFLMAYITASSITILSISIYTWFSNQSFKQSLSILTLLTALYAILYSLLQLEDYALLMGTALLLIILFVLMWITRNLKVSEK